MPRPSAPPRTISLYLRLSKAADDESTGLQSQEADLRALATARGLTVVAVHVDDGESGALRNRPGLLAWLADAREGRADHLAAWKLDRVSRGGSAGLAEFLDTLSGVDRDGRPCSPPVRFLSVADHLDSASPSWDLTAAVMGALAKAERDAIRSRIVRARAAREVSGRWNGGPTPFGYRAVPNPDGPGKVLDVDPDEAELVREAAARILAGDSLSSVVRYANSPDGYPPRRAAHWTRVALRQVLTGTIVAGQVIRVRDGVPAPVLDPQGRPVTVPAILTADESAALRAILTPKPDAKKGGRRPSRLLSGLLRCHACDEPLQVARRVDGSVTYRCQNGRETGTCAAPVSISALALEGYMASLFLSTYGSSPAYVRRAEIIGAAAVEAAERDVAEALAELASSATAEAFTRLQEAQAARDTALAAPQVAETRLVPTGRTVRETWHAAAVEDRRELLASHYAEIIVRPGRRGPRGIDPERLVVVMQPPFAAEGLPPEEYPAGRAVV